MSFPLDAACSLADRELFFPVESSSGEVRPADLERAAAFCRSCPVAQACLAFALDNGLDSGVFGGLSPAQRRELARV